MSSWRARVKTRSGLYSASLADFPHNSIAEPDRDYDNTTIWTEDFNRDYYLDLLFAEGEDVNSMRNFYIENSSNRYTVYGDVTDWVPLARAMPVIMTTAIRGPGCLCRLVFPDRYHQWLVRRSDRGWQDPS